MITPDQARHEWNRQLFTSGVTTGIFFVIPDNIFTQSARRPSHNTTTTKNCIKIRRHSPNLAPTQIRIRVCFFRGHVVDNRKKNRTGITFVDQMTIRPAESRHGLHRYQISENTSIDAGYHTASSIYTQPYTACAPDN